MIEQLSNDCFKPICAQIEQKKEGKVSLKDILDLTDVPIYRSTITMLKHFRDFETYLSQRYGVEIFPLDYIAWTTLVSASRGDFD